MTDQGEQTTGAAGDLVETPLTAEAAALRKSEMFRDKAFQQRLFRGEPGATKEFAQVIETLAASDTPKARDEERLQAFLDRADLPPEVVAQVRENRPVSAAEFDGATRERRRLMSDKAFVTRYLSGEVDAIRQMSLINVIRSSPIKS